MLHLFVGLRVGALITESAPILARRVDQNQSPTEGAGVIMKKSADTNVLAQEVTPIGGADPATQNHPEDDIYTQPNLNLLSTFQLTMHSFASHTILFGSSSNIYRGSSQSSIFNYDGNICLNALLTNLIMAVF